MTYCTLSTKTVSQKDPNYTSCSLPLKCFALSILLCTFVCFLKRELKSFEKAISMQPYIHSNLTFLTLDKFVSNKKIKSWHLGR